jgi:hypothetical protein
MTFDIPGNENCYTCNPQLWNVFVASYKRRFGFGPNPNADFTEAFCAQWVDNESLQLEQKKAVDSTK